MNSFTKYLSSGSILLFLISLQVDCQINLLNEEYTYHVGDSEPQTEWKAPDFDDSLWNKGTGAIGYGDVVFSPHFYFDPNFNPGAIPPGDTLINTLIPPATSLYVRYPFTIAATDTAHISGLSLEVDFDDGFIACLNGVEFARVNMGSPGSPVTYSTLSNRSHESPTASGDPYPVIGYYLNREFIDQYLKIGNNVITVEVHNDSVGGSDLFLNCGLFRCLRDTMYDPLVCFWRPDDIYTTTRIRAKACIPLDSTSLPLVIIETDEFGIPCEHKEVIAHMSIIDQGAGKYNSPMDTNFTYDGRISIEVRGGSSSLFPKQPFNIETQFDDGSNQNVSLMGMPSENDWRLIGPISDRSLIRHTLTYELGRRQGHWEPRSRYCEVIINGEYLGLYFMTEKIKPDNNRLDIASLDSTELSGNALTGGYIFWKWNEAGLACYYPTGDHIQPEQYEYIQSFADRFWTMLYSDDFSDPVKGFRSRVDVESMLDYLIINELAYEFDKYGSSTYMYKDRNDRDSLIHYGPLWDYNYAYGNTHQFADTDKWRFHEGGEQFRRYLQDTLLVKQFAERWHAQRQTFLHTDSIFHLIDSLSEHFAESRMRDSMVWGPYATVNVYFADDTEFAYDQVITKLKDWIARRVLWIDSHIDSIYYPLNGELPDEITQITSRGSLDVFPNPFRDELYLEANMRSPGQLQLRLLTLQGQVLDESIRSVEEGSQELRWKVGGEIDPGMYILQILLDNKLIESKKLLKKP